MAEPLAPPGYTVHESGLLMPVDLRADALSDLASPTAWLLDAFTTGRVHSGQAVSPQSSMGLSAYYACLNVIAQDCAKLPLPIYRELDRGREKERDHPLWDILQYRFNNDMTAYIGRYVMTHHAVGWGNGYGLILRDRSLTRTDGQVTGIYPIHPSRVRVERDSATGELAYDISQVSRFPRDRADVPVRVPASDMIHLKGPTGDGIVGYSMAQIAAESIGMGLAAQEYGASFFGNSSIPTGILSHPGKFKDENAIKALRKRWEGRRNGTAVLEEGLTWTSITIPPEAAQYLETRQFQVLEICRWFRMAPHKIGDLSNAHFTNIEHQAIEYVQDTLMPWLIMIEQELCTKLLSPSDGLYIRHDTRALMRGDSKARSEYYRALFQVAALSPNDIRELEDENPYVGGDEYFLQIQYAPVRKIVDGTAMQPRQARRPASPSEQAAATNGSVMAERE